MATITLNANQKIARHPDLFAVPMNDELVMMSISEGTYYGVNPVGVRIWQALETPQTIQSICTIVQADFDVQADQCEKDVHQFIENMLASKIVQMI